MKRTERIQITGKACLFAILVAAPACAQTPSAATRPAAPATASAPASALASQPEVVDPNVLKILQDMEKVGEKYSTLSADVKYVVEKTMLGDEEVRTGRISVARGGAKGGDRFYIRFDTLKQGEGAAINDLIEYALDGEWITEVKHRIKTLTRYQVVEPGKKVDLLRMGGKSPIQLPFGQKAEDILARFQASTRPPRPGDPSGSVYVKLVARPQSQADAGFLRSEMWLDAKTLLPMKAVSEDKNKDVTTATFTKVQANEKVDEKLFTIDLKDKPSPPWQHRVEPLERK